MALTRKTVFVLGAGASADFGFPSGRELLRQIVTAIQTERKVYKRLRDLDIGTRVLKQFATDLGESMQPSVDAFLENRPDLVSVGKLAIAAALIPFEQGERLTERPERMTWCEYLFPRLGLTPDGIPQTNVSFVTFNYDRSFTRFLYNALSKSYQLNDAETAQLVKLIEPIHVYGKLGELPELYGKEKGFARLYSGKHDAIKGASECIKIFSEEETTYELEQARYALQEATVIVFLGFGYLPLNVARLQISSGARRPTICGSAFGMGAGERISATAAFKGQTLHLGKPEWDALEFLRQSPFLALAEGAKIGSLRDWP